MQMPAIELMDYIKSIEESRTLSPSHLTQEQIMALPIGNSK